VAIGANGILDIIDHGRTGLLASPGNDTVRQIIDNVQLLVDNPILRENMSHEAREWAEQWNWQAATQKLRTSQYRAAISLHQIRSNQTRDDAGTSSLISSLGGGKWFSLLHRLFFVHLLRWSNDKILQGEAEIMRKYSV
jgi:hypothetical protein